MSANDDFKKYFPEITDMTVTNAASKFGIGDEILSLDGKRTGLDYFILNLATDGQIHGPFLMNSTCAHALYDLLVSAGFGPQSSKHPA